MEFISKNKEGKSLLEVTEYVQLPKSSVYNILQTFVNLRYLTKEKRTNIYRLGLQAFELGARYIENDELFRESKDVLKEISRKTEETSHFAILDGREVVYINKNESTLPIRMVSSVGKKNPAHATALGKVLLSGLQDEEIAQLYMEKQLPSLTPKTITDLDVLLRQIGEIRKVGVGFECEESTPNIQCIAVPIKQRSGKVVAAISVSIPLFRMKDHAFYIEALQEGAEKLACYS